MVAYDRRGYGRTGPSPAPFTHVDDLLAVLDQFTDGPAWLAGASAGGGLALDTALLAPERVAGLILIAPAVTGAPEPEIDPATQVLSDLLDAAYDANDAAEINRLETWIWLDGPAQPEGRVSGPARDLALDMNAVIMGRGDLEEARRIRHRRVGPARRDPGAGHRGLRRPGRAVPGQPVPRARLRLPRGQHEVLPGLAHQPYLEQPALVAELITEAMAAGGHPAEAGLAARPAYGSPRTFFMVAISSRLA